MAGLILHDPALAMGYGELDGVREVVSEIPTVSYTSDECAPAQSLTRISTASQESWDSVGGEDSSEETGLLG